MNNCEVIHCNRTAKWRVVYTDDAEWRPEGMLLCDTHEDSAAEHGIRCEKEEAHQ